MMLRASITPPAAGPVFDRIAHRAADVGGAEVRRMIPSARRRTVGPWCFVDHFGPGDPRGAMQVDPHPHIGLQTVTWLLAGEIEHRDSLGSVQRIRPGQLNWMTAGRGIVHAELGVTGPIEGVQLWVALPDAHRAVAPRFDHLAELPIVEASHGHATVLAGALGGLTSAAPRFHPLVGAEIRGQMTVALDPSFEHAFLPLRGGSHLDGEAVAEHQLVYLGQGRTELTIDTTVGMLVGGAPLGEPILMWWNFVARTHDEILAAREAWASDGMAAVPDTPGRTPAPPLR